jgi:DNA-binding NarL/FixJ family response regulator
VIRVLIADDESLVRGGLRMILEAQEDIEVAAEAEDGHRAVRLAEQLEPDVVLMDIRMPGLDGLEAMRRILAARARGPRIVVLTTFDLDESAARAIRGGASGFVLKDADPEFLLAAIRTVHAGNSVIAASATKELLEHFGPGEPRRTEPEAFGTLTARERDIFLLAARGLSNAEIAGSEFLSEATVKTHVSRILAKLGLRDRVQLVVFAFEHRLVA